jgi:hypothetical protein
MSVYWGHACEAYRYRRSLDIRIQKVSVCRLMVGDCFNCEVFDEEERMLFAAMRFPNASLYLNIMMDIM